MKKFIYRSVSVLLLIVLFTLTGYTDTTKVFVNAIFVAWVFESLIFEPWPKFKKKIQGKK